MESSAHLYLESVLGICLALFIGSILYLFSQKVKSIPYTVMLLFLGMSIAPFNLAPFETIRLTPGSVLFIFLPVLLFESAFNFDFREFKRILAPGFFLASIGLMISAAFIAIVLQAAFNIPFLHGFMYGSVISSTDPIAVLTIFKQLGVPKKLQLLVDGESFLNDATSVIMFRILSTSLTGAVVGFEKSDIYSGLGSFAIVLIGGIAIGAILGIFFSELISRIKNVNSVEITLTIILAHLVFIIAEDLFHVSGIIAVLVAGLVLGNYGRTKISPGIAHNMHQMWDMLVFLSTSIVFLLIGYEIDLNGLGHNLKMVVIATLALLAGRALSVYILAPIYNLFTKKENRIPLSWMHIANWGGLRGSLPLIVVLSLPETYEYKELFVELVLGAILFTLVINALTIKPLIKFLKLDRLNSVHEIEIKVTQAFVYKNLMKYLKQLMDHEEICDVTHKLTLEKVEKNFQETIGTLNSWGAEHSLSEYNIEMEKVLRRYCLQIEKTTYRKLFRRGVIPENVYNRLKQSAVLQIEALDEGEEQFSKTGDTVNRKQDTGSSSIKANVFERIQSKLGLIHDVESKVLKRYYIYHKARILGDEAVLEELEDIVNESIFPEKIVKKLFQFYTDLFAYNHITLNNIESQNKEMTLEVEANFVKKESDYFIHHILEEFGEEGRVSVKALQNINLTV